MVHLKGQRSLTVGGRITVQLVSGLTRLELTKKENLLIFVCSEAVESILEKLETSCTVILRPTVSVMWKVKFFRETQTNVYAEMVRSV